MRRTAYPRPELERKNWENLCGEWEFDFDFGKSGKEITERKNNSKIWKAKFDQVLMKGRSLRGDSDFQKQLDYYENYFNK